MGVTLGVLYAEDATGWTTITPSVDTQIRYLSSSVATTGDGSYASPWKTLKEGMDWLNSFNVPSGSGGSVPHWLCLKAGDTWTDQTFGGPTGLGQIKVSGRSATEPLVITSYGTGPVYGVEPRPLIKSPPAIVYYVLYTGGGGSGAGGGDYMAVIGLEFYCYKRDPANPSFVGAPVTTQPFVLQSTNRMNFMLWENNKISFYYNGFGFQPGFALYEPGGLIFRRNVLVDCHGSGGRPQGIFLGGINSYRIEENFVDQCGWYPGLTGSERNAFNHNLYLNSDNPPNMGRTYTAGPADAISLRGNILARGAAHGSKSQLGGRVDDNLWPNNPIANISAAFCSGQNTFNDNVIINGTDVPGVATAFGVDVVNTDTSGGGTADHCFASGGTFVAMRNVLMNAPTPGQFAFRVLYNFTNGTIKDNVIYHWSNTPFVDQSGGVNVIGPNEIDQTGYQAPTRSLDSYSTFVGGAGTEADFYAQCRLQSKANWRKEYTAVYVNDYLRGGFGRRKQLKVRC